MPDTFRTATTPVAPTGAPTAFPPRIPPAVGATSSTLYIDPDFRPTPKTQHFCCVCQRDIKQGAGHRMVFLRPQEGFTEIDHPSSPSPEAFPHPIGMNCAKKLGLEWSVAP